MSATMSEDAAVTVEAADGVTTIRMNRPDKKNALTRAMYARMGEALRAADADERTRAVVIAGAPGAFCAGNDIADFVAIAEGGDEPAEVAAFLHGLVDCETPIVAAVDGLAIGIGTTLLMHCDLAFASRRSQFRTPFVDLGITPEAASSLLAPRIMGHQRAFALLVMGEALDAEGAKDAGLVTRVVEDPDVAADEAASALAAKPAEAVRIARALLRDDREALHARIDREIGHFTERLRSREAQATFRAFLNR